MRRAAKAQPTVNLGGDPSNLESARVFSIGRYAKLIAVMSRYLIIRFFSLLLAP
jgi:hypothetical protein